MTDLQKAKLGSRRFWIVLWSCLIITVWGSVSLILGLAPVWLTSVLTLMVAIPTSYVTITSIKKPKE